MKSSVTLEVRPFLLVLKLFWENFIKIVNIELKTHVLLQILEKILFELKLVIEHFGNIVNPMLPNLY